MVSAEPLTLAVPVGRLDRALEKVSAASSLTLKCDPALASEIVFVDAKAMPVEDLLASLGRVTAGFWEKQPDGSIVLKRSAGFLESERSKEISRRLKALEEWRNGLLKSLAVTFDEVSLEKIVGEKFAADKRRYEEGLSEEESERLWLRIQDLNRIDPVLRALGRCVRGLDLRPVANLGPGESIVFSSTPNPAQKLLTGNWEEACAKLQSEQLAWGRTLKRHAQLNGGESEHHFQNDSTIESFDEDQSGMFSAGAEPWQRTVPYKRLPTQAYVRANAARSGEFTFEIMLIDAAGVPAMCFAGDGVDDNQPYKEPDISDLKIPKPSDEMAALIKRLSVSGEAAKPLIQKLVPYFENPASNDPLALGNQELLTAIADQKKKSVIACLPDSANQIYSEDGFDFRALYSPYYSNLAVSETTTAVEFRPENFYNHLTTRTSRKGIAGAVDELRRTGAISVMSFVRLAAETLDVGSMGCTFVQLANPHYKMRYGSYTLPSEAPYLTLLASLRPDQLDRLRKGQTIPYRELTAAQQRSASALVYGGGLAGGWQISGDEPVLAAVEPTYALPNGLFTGRGLSAKFDDTDVAVWHGPVLDESSDEEQRVISLVTDKDERYALSDGWGGRTLVPASMGSVTFDFRRKERIQLRCEVIGEKVVEGVFEAPLGPATSKPIPLKDLSAELQKKLKPVIESWEQARKWENEIRQMRGGEPPPGRLF